MIRSVPKNVPTIEPASTPPEYWPGQPCATVPPAGTVVVACRAKSWAKEGDSSLCVGVMAGCELSATELRLNEAGATYHGGAPEVSRLWGGDGLALGTKNSGVRCCRYPDELASARSVVCSGIAL